jgi:hypothetical protein|eukprot:CAMPEP_0197266120 /NCGR_PEP_ID=MMETSP1432-20130617/2813_1 /TAXON_ID=44447 /ORGANISM="Pseudo-nitzschia delicatissima, Strain UNC1205" /LENGTH=208 /DNA_ID=CAMNT_0042730949 /DNA_START=108 /DNA_END=734 /DNA_ORIENTATION=+
MIAERSSTISCSRTCLALILALSHLLLSPVSSFVQQQPQTARITKYSSTVSCGMGSKSTEVNDEIAKQLERAKAALAVSRAKMEAKEQAEAGLLDDDQEEEGKSDDEAVPFFAMNADDENGKKEKVIKDKKENGGFTTDGDLMAKLSEEEEWESRPLLEVFQNEREEKTEAMNIDRDIGQSMYNLRKSLQTDDFMKIFDKRNRFIGEA